MKAYEIPVSFPVLKMLIRDYGYANHMRIDRQILGKAQGDPMTHSRYINTTTESQVRITIICKYASPAKLYTVCRLMEHEFKTKMLLYIEAAVESGMEAAEAIRRFMDKYDLSMEDLEMETAYKQWQRYQKKEKEKNLLPLWVVPQKLGSRVGGK
jgi:hypothetical protein